MKLVLFALFYLFVLASCSRGHGSGYSYESRRPHNGDEAVRLIGDVKDVLDGRVTAEFENYVWPAPKIGFGAATVGPLQAEGETFFANGYAFVRQTDNTTSNYYETVSAESFRSPFSVVLPNHLKPDGIARYVSSASNAITWSQLYTNIYNSVEGSPYCFWGFADFTYVNAIAVSKAPIWGESLFGAAKPTYYTRPNFNLTNVHALTFGCAANYSSFTDPALAAQLNKALYINPLDPSAASSLQNHGHIITLHDSVDDLDDVHPNKVTGVYHLLTDSKINFINAKVFKLDHADKLSTISSPPRKNKGY